MLAGGFWFGLGSFRVGNIETAEEISKERGASDTESLAVRVKFGPKPVKSPTISSISLHRSKGEMNLWTMEIQQQLFPCCFLTYSLSIVQSKWLLAFHKSQNLLPLFT